MSSFESSGYIAYRSFFTLLWHPSTQDLLLEIPESRHGRLVVVVAEIAASDSEEYILHQPAGSTYWLPKPRADNVTLDLLQPLLETSRLGPGTTVTGAAEEGALAPIRLANLRPWDFGSNGVPQFRISRDDDSDGPCPLPGAASAFGSCRHSGLTPLWARPLSPLQGLQAARPPSSS